MLSQSGDAGVTVFNIKEVADILEWLVLEVLGWCKYNVIIFAPT